MALLTLIRCATGEDFNAIMADLQVTEDCDPNPNWDDPDPQGCGSPVAAYVYFYSVVLLIAFVLINLLLAAILSAFTDSSAEEDARLSKEQLEVFATVWAEYD